LGGHAEIHRLLTAFSRHRHFQRRRRSHRQKGTWAAGGGFLAGVALLAAALARNYFLHRPISTSIGEEQTTLFIAGGSFPGLARGFSVAQGVGGSNPGLRSMSQT
jgi:hypothetical protein